MPFDPEQTRLQDRELKMLAIEAQRHPPKSPERRKALTKLVEKIRESGRLCRPRRGEFGDRYEEIYEEAVQELMVYICHDINKYNPEKSPVMRWVNFLLSKRFFNEAIPVIIGSPDLRIEPLDENNIEQSEEQPLMSEVLWEYLENDPEQLCQNLRHPKHPQVNFQVLAMRRIRGEKWKTISADLGVPISTLSDFYQDSIRELSPKIKLYLNK